VSDSSRSLSHFLLTVDTLTQGELFLVAQAIHQETRKRLDKKRCLSTAMRARKIHHLPGRSATYPSCGQATIPFNDTSTTCAAAVTCKRCMKTDYYLHAAGTLVTDEENATGCA